MYAYSIRPDCCLDRGLGDRPQCHGVERPFPSPKLNQRSKIYTLQLSETSMLLVVLSGYVKLASTVWWGGGSFAQTIRRVNSQLGENLDPDTEDGPSRLGIMGMKNAISCHGVRRRHRAHVRRGLGCRHTGSMASLFRWLGSVTPAWGDGDTDEMDSMLGRPCCSPAVYVVRPGGLRKSWHGCEKGLSLEMNRQTCPPCRIVGSTNIPPRHPRIRNHAFLNSPNWRPRKPPFLISETASGINIALEISHREHTWGWIACNRDRAKTKTGDLAGHRPPVSIPSVLDLYFFFPFFFFFLFGYVCISL